MKRHQRGKETQKSRQEWWKEEMGRSFLQRRKEKLEEVDNVKGQRRIIKELGHQKRRRKWRWKVTKGYAGARMEE